MLRTKNIQKESGETAQDPQETEGSDHPQQQDDLGVKAVICRKQRQSHSALLPFSVGLVLCCLPSRSLGSMLPRTSDTPSSCLGHVPPWTRSQAGSARAVQRAVMDRAPGRADTRLRSGCLGKEEAPLRLRAAGTVEPGGAYMSSAAAALRRDGDRRTGQNTHTVTFTQKYGSDRGSSGWYNV